MKARKPGQPLENLLDKAIAYVAPRAAARRRHAREFLALSGGYTGARRDRAATGDWRLPTGGPQSDVIVDLPELRARSRDLERNSPVAGSVINTTVTHAVGTGLACMPKIDAEFLGYSEEEAQAWQAGTQRRFRAWAESKDCDLGRFLDFYELQDVALRSTLASGDVFVNTPMVQRATARAAQLALQLVEADRVSNPLGQRDTDTITDGIEHDAQTGEAIAYHFCNRHPGDQFLGARKWERVPARGAVSGRRNVLHLFRQLRPNLRRGVPILASVIEPLKQLSTYTDAELQAAVVSGLWSVFIKMDASAFNEMFDEDSKKLIVDKSSKWSGSIESGKAVNLLPGESVESPNPGRPNAQFDPFVQACIRQIGMAIGLPYEVLVMHYQSSYSAARGALLMAWRFFMGHRNWLASNLCQPVYEIWLADQVARGEIAAPGFFADELLRHAWTRAQWVGDGPGSIDPAKEVAAAKERVELEISTLQAESLLHDGVDWETKHRQRAKEVAMQKRDGTAPEPKPVAAPGQPPQPGRDDDDDTEDGDDDTEGRPPRRRGAPNTQPEEAS